MFLFYSAPLYRLQENGVSLDILIWINIFEFNSLFHRQIHTLHHFRLSIHQCFWYSSCNNISSTSVGKTSSAHWIFPLKSQPCCDMPSIVKDAVVERFHSDVPMLNLRICNHKTELHGGSAIISITLFSLVYFLP